MCSAVANVGGPCSANEAEAEAESVVDAEESD
jgi:hypothetical protein